MPSSPVRTTSTDLGRSCFLRAVALGSAPGSRESFAEPHRSEGSLSIQRVHRDHSESPQFRHEALPYESSDLLLEQVTSFLGPALDREEPVLIAAQSDTLSGFRTGFIGRRTHIDLAPMEEVGRNPGRLISVWSDFLAQHGAQGRTMWE